MAVPSWSGRSVVVSGYLLGRSILYCIYQSYGFGYFVTNLVDGAEKISVVDPPPLVARKRSTS